MIEKLFQKLENRFDEMVEIRRYLHQHPELSFQEIKTAKYILEYYKKLGIEARGNVGGNGVVAAISGIKPGKTIALRADFDALPIQDEKDVPYKSTVPGVMHACGHDGHTAALLVLAKTLNEMKEEISGKIVFIHQHAEELVPGGAKPMIEDGCLDGVDAIYGTHLWATVPTGILQYRKGPVMAAVDRFEIEIKGKGGHGAQPHKTKDAIVAAAQLVINLQQIVSRRVNPIDSAVVTVGSFVADNSFNIIADKVKLAGTVRTFNEKVQNTIMEEMERIIKGTCLANDCQYELSYEKGYPAVVNHDKNVDYIISCAKNIDEIHTIEETEPIMGGEDFAYYLQHVEGAFFFIGAKQEETDNPFPHHHPKFDFNEKAMLIAAKTLGSLALNGK